MIKTFSFFLASLMALSLQAAFAQNTVTIPNSPSVNSVNMEEERAAAPNAASPVLNHIAVHVHDLQKSADFYEQVVQLPQIPEPFQDNLHAWFSIGQGQLHLIAGAPANQPRNKHNHLCFSVHSIEDFIERLEQHGIAYSNWAGDSKEPTVRPDGVKQIYFQDPDGHWIEVNNDR